MNTTKIEWPAKLEDGALDNFDGEQDRLDAAQVEGLEVLKDYGVTLVRIEGDTFRFAGDRAAFDALLENVRGACLVDEAGLWLASLEA